MRKKANKFWLKKLLDYLVSVDLYWLVIWGTIFVSFVILDSIFQSTYPGRNIFWNIPFGDTYIRFMVIENGTFFGVTLLKYTGIVLSFIYAKQKFPKDYILQIALAFTLLADTILTFDQINVFGVLAFCFAQYFHIARFAKVNPKFFIIWTFFLLLLLILGYYNNIQDIFILAFIYAISITGNLILTHRWMKTTRKKYQKKLQKCILEKEVVASTCAFYGFILFIACDINVAISYLSVTGAFPLTLARYANFFAWLFYYPSQVLISNSSIKVEKIFNFKKKIQKIN